MKTQNILLALVALTLILTNEGRAQGSLTPPGAPGETMRSLDQVEPRTPIPSAPFIINASGSYYLTANLTPSGTDNAITITASDVSLDLNGFTISGKAANGDGVSLSTVENVVIENGSIRDCYYSGASTYSASNCVYRNLRLIGNARHNVANAGLVGGLACVIENCYVKTMREWGS